MKITALGVNSAFAIGDYKNAVSIDEIKNTVKEFKNNGKITLNQLLAKLEDKAQKLYYPKWQSNFLIEFERTGQENPYRLIMDFGGDIRHSLAEVGLNINDIDAFYCSHPHADHIGGVEFIALSTLFNPFYRSGKVEWMKDDEGNFRNLPKRLAEGEEIPAEYRPTLYAHKSVLNELWHAAQPGLETIQGVPDVNLETFFDVHEMYDNKPLVMEDGKRHWKMFTVTSVHINAGYRQMPSFGLWIEGSDGQIIFMPTDTQFMTPKQVSLYYDRASVIYQDCETGPRSDVHPHIEDLQTLEPETKKKCLLYHYNIPPEGVDDEFGEILVRGRTHEY